MSTPEIQLLGTGTAFQQDGRGAQCILITDSSGELIAVDVGPTAAAAATRYQAPLARMRHLFITHLHGDHIAGWPFVALQMIFLEKRTAPLDIWGPPGVQERLEGLLRLCYPKIAAEQATSLPISYHEVEVARKDALRAGGVSFDTFPMEHDASSIGFGLRVASSYLGVSGDTQWCSGLEELAQRSDLLFVECTTLEKSDYTHLSLEEIRQYRAKLPHGKWVLVHLPDEVAVDLAADPISGVVAASDGMRIQL
jgi:ribonuclease BN (tRNA processing enzyme)